MTSSGQPPYGSPPAPGVVPLSPERFKVQFTIGVQTLEKMRLAQDMLRHAIPSGDQAAIFDRALTVLLSELARKKFAATEKPRPAAPATSGSRHVPAEVRRAVWQRDLGRCAFTSAEGRRCSERAFLEFHHDEPYAIGGEATVANIQLRCRQHNGFESQLVFGATAGGGNSFRNESRPGASPGQRTVCRTVLPPIRAADLRQLPLRLQSRGLVRSCGALGRPGVVPAPERLAVRLEASGDCGCPQLHSEPARLDAFRGDLVVPQVKLAHGPVHSAIGVVPRQPDR